VWGVHGQLDNLKTLMRDGRGWGIFRNIRVLASKCVLDTCLTSGEPRNNLLQGGGQVTKKAPREDVYGGTFLKFCVFEPL